MLKDKIRGGINYTKGLMIKIEIKNKLKNNYEFLIEW